MGYFANQLRKIADSHTEQAASLARDGADDGLLSQRDEATSKADRKRAIQSHLRRAAELNAEADNADNS
jgi:hypothetical protein